MKYFPESVLPVDFALVIIGSSNEILSHMHAAVDFLARHSIIIIIILMVRITMI